MTDLYKKIGRRYHKIGREFTGFPANGYWHVLDGRNSLLVPIDHPRPLELLRYMQYRDRIVDSLSCIDAMSRQDLVSFVLTQLEDLCYEDACTFKNITKANRARR